MFLISEPRLGKSYRIGLDDLSQDHYDDLVELNGPSYEDLLEHPLWRRTEEGGLTIELYDRTFPRAD